MSKGKALLYAYGISSFSNFNGAPPLKQVMKIPPLLRRDRDAIGRACAGRRLEWLGCVSSLVSSTSRRESVRRRHRGSALGKRLRRVETRQVRLGRQRISRRSGS